ncbi:FAD-binding oxidoreductase [Cellulomonas sp. PhB150]|uniref:NAD(P)/FAD-dependent oxidoreductase n=1 Tax=Cellulomonas sp. PhB150 TaxID=2485188 RepID=UPI000F93FBEE|nr:FAD-binding oxidoreductase [Cellulomonas sp. PhB150]ROS28106.1 glycine/D-amino acid oxidase-like deaminating enzyme [Cellulomonas sp. PhB150]
MTSLWSAHLADRRPTEPLDGDTTADVVVVGAGLTGLWTAYYLLDADAALDVLLLDAGVVGEGASTQGLGACSADLAISAERVALAFGRDAALDLRAAMRDAVVEVGGALALEQVECGFGFGGALRVARSTAQVERLGELVATAPTWGDEWSLLDAAGAQEHVRVPGVKAGAWTPDCAVLDPARLVRGLLDVLLARGVRLAERTTAQRVSPHAVLTDRGTVRAPVVLTTVEAGVPGVATGRTLAAVPAHALATTRLDARAWGEIGLEPGVVVREAAHLPVQARRTADDRLLLTGAGHPSALDRALATLFPVADPAGALRWSGRLGVPRDGLPSVELDPASGLGGAGGFGASGVTAANLAGRTLADLACGVESSLVHLPWVGHRSPDWPPLGGAAVSLAMRAAARADAAESAGRRSRTAAAVLDRVPIG